MADTLVWYKKALEKLAQGVFKWKASAGSTIKVMLLSSGYSPNMTTDEFISSLSANEVTGTGYTAGGYTITLTDAAYSAGSSAVILDATDPTWTLTGKFSAPVKYAAIYDASTGVAATSPVLALLTLETARDPENSAFTLTWAATGPLKIA